MKPESFFPVSSRRTSCVTAHSDPVGEMRRPVILIADDDLYMRRYLFLVLSGAGFEVDAVPDGQEAWEALLKRHYDLLISDNDMPRLSGLRLVERLREAGMILPVLIASGSLPAEKAIDSPQLHLTGILPKPFGRLELLDEVRNALSSGADPANADREQLGEASSERGGGLPKDHADTPKTCSFGEHEATGPSAPLPATFVPPNAPPPKRPRILVADDDSLVRGSLAAVLNSEGYEVAEARDGIEAVAQAIEHSAALVLLDLNMPRWDGWTVFGKLDRLQPLMPVIVITARPHQYREAVRLRVDAFMEKPLNIRVLVRAIKRFTADAENLHARRITDPGFVTQWLDSGDSSFEPKDRP